MVNEIENIGENDLLNTSTDDWCDYFQNEYCITVPTLEEERITTDQQECQIDARNLPNRAILDYSHPVYIPGTEFTIHVPYSGDKALFKCRPSSFTLNPPHATIHEEELVFTYDQPEPDAAAVRGNFDREMTEIKNWLNCIEADLKPFNDSIRGNAKSSIESRRQRLLKNREMQEALGFSMRRREDAPATYVAPQVKRKPKISKPAAASGEAFRPEPALEIAQYEHILTVIQNMVHVMERSPKAFQEMGEEDLRQHFLVQLNGQYEGQATGETFNFEGKTDILIRAEDRNIFIAECKFWKGPKALVKTIDQILGYASWRDTKIAIVLFNRTKDFTKVLEQITPTLEAHSNYKRTEDYLSDTGFRFVFHHKDDRNRELTMTVLAFEVPGKDT